jgi:uncharacterized membrane protein required for colicin V production
VWRGNLRFQILDNSSPIPLDFTTVALGIVATTMLIGTVRGVVRIVFSLAALVAGVLVAYLVYERLPGYSATLDHPFTPRTIVYTAIGVGVAMFFMVRVVIGKLLNPLAFVDGKPRGRGVVGALFGLVPAVAIVWIIVVALRMTGAVEDLGHMDKSVRAEEGTVEPESPWLARLRATMKSDTVVQWMARLDPFIDQGKEALSKLLISAQDAAVAEQLEGNSADVGKVLNDPKVRALLEDPEIMNLLKRGEHVALMQNPKIRAAAESLQMNERVNEMEVEKEVDRALYTQPEAEETAPRVRKKPRLRFGNFSHPGR